MNLIKKLLGFTTTFYKKNLIISPTINCVFISITTTLLIYLVFFYFSGIIWSMYTPVDPMLLAPYVRSWSNIDHDGVEPYVMYVLVIFSVSLALFISLHHSYVIKKHEVGHYMYLFYSLMPIVFIICSILLFYHIGFHPPMIDISHNKHLWFIEIIVLLSLWGLIKFSRLPDPWATVILVLVLFPICFVAMSEISLFDYEFVFSPALRLIHGFELKDIYFQYDIFLSLLAAGWMKLNFNLADFRIVAQLSIYGLILAEFIIAKRLFYSKNLAYYLLATLVLIKIYAYFIDPTYCIQLTPLRLDLWVVPFIIVIWRGCYSLILGSCLAALIIVHRTFGFLYTISYFELLFILFVIDFYDKKINLKKLMINHMALILPNLLIIFFALCVNYCLFKSNIPVSALLYQQLGIGFLRISQISYYWYVPILLSSTCILLFKQKKILLNFYFNSGIFLILLSIANSVYFFGRSHESNIMHVSGSLFFILFLLLDLLYNSCYPKNSIVRSTNKKRIVAIFPVILIMMIAYFYSERIYRNLNIQVKNIYSHKFQYPLSFDKDINSLRIITHNSNKIYTLGLLDFYYLYLGNYIPQGYFSPYVSWPFKKDLVGFLQNLININYYIVIPIDELAHEKEILDSLLYEHTVSNNYYKVIWK